MSTWVLVIAVFTAQHGVTTVDNFPSQASCEYAKRQLQESTWGYRLAEAAVCIERRP